METQVNTTHTTERSRRDRLTVGVVLIAIGVLLLIGQVFETWIALPALAVGFLVAGAYRREAGWMIPGGILSGISLGIFLLDGPYAGAEGELQGGIFLLAFAAGWLLIVLLSALLTTERQWWALIPAGIFALIGMAVLGGGIWMTALSLVGRFWPLALIVAGLALLVGWRRREA
jgi:hypothetical protein